MYLITSVNRQGGTRTDIPAANEPPRQFTSNYVNMELTGNYQESMKEIQSYTTEREEDVPAIVDYLTRNFSGRDVSVFKLQSVSVRAPGEIVTKDISKDGVLPR